jgi:hypothetical protein
MSASYADDAPATASPGFWIVAMGSLVAVILLIVALVYNSGRTARIGGLYSSVAAPANQAIAASVHAYNRDQRTNLAAAKADLVKLDQAYASFDSSIRAVTLPHAASDAAARLVNADLQREALIRQQEKATSLRQLRSFATRVQSANAAVEAQVQQTRQALGLPLASGQQF